jgi:hypothetical protein
VGPLADGLYTLSVRAGRAVPQSSTVEFDDTPATATWRVDTTPPSTTLTGPDAQTSSRNARFDFGAEDATDVSFTCQLDSEPAAPCSAPRKDYANVGLGTHTFKLVAKDTVNNTAPAREWTWKVVSDNDGDGINLPEDCDDANAGIRPGAVEIPENGIDGLEARDPLRRQGLPVQAQVGGLQERQGERHQAAQEGAAPQGSSHRDARERSRHDDQDLAPHVTRSQGAGDHDAVPQARRQEGRLV